MGGERSLLKETRLGVTLNILPAVCHPESWFQLSVMLNPGFNPEDLRKPNNAKAEVARPQGLS